MFLIGGAGVCARDGPRPAAETLFAGGRGRWGPVGPKRDDTPMEFLSRKIPFKRFQRTYPYMAYWPDKKRGGHVLVVLSNMLKAILGRASVTCIAGMVEEGDRKNCKSLQDVVGLESLEGPIMESLG